MPFPAAEGIRTVLKIVLGFCQLALFPCPVGEFYLMSVHLTRNRRSKPGLSVFDLIFLLGPDGGWVPANFLQVV
jgi:hypothetical protein